MFVVCQCIYFTVQNKMAFVFRTLLFEMGSQTVLLKLAAFYSYSCVSLKRILLFQSPRCWGYSHAPLVRSHGFSYLCSKRIPELWKVMQTIPQWIFEYFSKWGTKKNPFLLKQAVRKVSGGKVQWCGYDSSVFINVLEVRASPNLPSGTVVFYPQHANLNVFQLSLRTLEEYFMTTC